MRPLDPRLLHHARAVRTLVAGSVVIGGLAALATIAQAVLLADVLVRAVLGGAGVGALTRPLVALAAVVLVRAGLAWAAEELARRSAHRMTAQLRRALLVKAIALGPRWSGHQRRGELAALATTGVDGLETYAARYLPQLVLASVVPVIVLAWLVTADLLSAGIVAVTLPLIPVFMALVGWHTQRRTADRWHALELLSGHFLDVVSGLPTLKVFGRARAQAEAVRRTTGEYRRTTMVTLRVAFLSSLVLELVATLSVALVAVSVGLRLVDGSLDLRTGLAVLVLVPEAYLPLRAVGAQFHASTDGLVAAERVFAVLETPEPVHGTAARVPSPALAAIGLRGVRVRHADRDADALDCPDLLVRPGVLTAVVGPSGAGKTTLLLVLAGLVVPDAGIVRVGGTGAAGVDLADVDPAVWRSRTAHLGQAPRLVAGTVRDNLLLGNGDASGARVWDALRLAAVDDVVRALPDGLETEVGEGGALLSAGQRQRIALARAFLRDAPLVLLDEPTSALDAETERLVLAGVAQHARSGVQPGGGGRTVVIAAHRAAVLDIAEDVVDLHAGARTLAAAR